jgi:hypothetical protein
MRTYSLAAAEYNSNYIILRAKAGYREYGKPVQTIEDASGSKSNIH